MSRRRRAWGVRGARLRDRLKAERGLTIVEVMVAAMILVLGAIAIFKIVDAATRTSYRAEQSQVVSNLLQRELERVKAMEPGQMVMTTTPLPATCLENRTTAAQGAPSVSLIDASRFIASGEGTIKCEEVVSASTGSDGASDVGVTLYRFVTWFDPDKPGCVAPSGSADDENACGMRRITIGAKPVDSGPGGERTYKEIQSDVMDSPGESE